jgi:hypothetical protein
MADDWDTAKAKALKVLGDKGQVPDLPDTINKSFTACSKALEEFKKNQTACAKNVTDMEDANDTMKNAWKNYKATIDKADFNLSSSDKGDLKKITQARKILMDSLKMEINACELCDKDFDKVRDQIMQVTPHT